jgi:hypothetical protein
MDERCVGRRERIQKKRQTGDGKYNDLLALEKRKREEEDEEKSINEPDERGLGGRKRKKEEMRMGRRGRGRKCQDDGTSRWPPTTEGGGGVEGG